MDSALHMIHTGLGPDSLHSYNKYVYLDYATMIGKPKYTIIIASNHDNALWSVLHVFYQLVLV